MRQALCGRQRALRVLNLADAHRPVATVKHQDRPSLRLPDADTDQDARDAGRLTDLIHVPEAGDGEGSIHPGSALTRITPGAGRSTCAASHEAEAKEEAAVRKAVHRPVLSLPE